MGALLPLAVLAFFLLGKKSGAVGPAAPSAPPVITFGPAENVQQVKPRPQRPVGSRPGGTVEVLPPSPRPVAAAAPRPAQSVKPASAAATNDALQAALLAEQQMGKPQATQQVTVKPVAAATPAARPTAVAQVVPDPRPSALPAGYDQAAASARAQPMADHIRTRKGKYDRAVLSSWQMLAGLKQDGLYGPQSAAALRYFGAKNVPAPLFKGSQTTYTPPRG